MSKLLQLRRERAGLIQKAKHLVDIADQESRGLTEQEERDYGDFMGQIDDLAVEIERRERLEDMARDLDKPEKREAVKPMPDPNIGMTKREVEQYSLVRAIRAAGNRDWRGAELELEASKAVAKQLGQDPQGFFVPYDWAARSQEQRDLTKGVPSAGGYMVDEVLSTSFIELLRNRMVVRQAGATVLTGLEGDIAIPKQTGGATAYWVAEGGAPTESQQTIGQVLLRPKTLGAFTDYSRKLMLQSSIDIEAFVRNDLAAVLQLEVDRVALHGTGAANQPLGIANTTGIGAPGIGAATLAMIVDLETAVAVDNADMGRLAYMTNATARGALKKADAGTDTGLRVWDSRAGNTPLNGYPAWVTNQVSGNYVFFGNWADLIIAFWSGLDIMVDPYTHSTSGTMRVVALQDVDTAVRHAESFALDAVA